MLDELLNLLAISALFASAQLYLVQFVRALPWPTTWKARKPLSCDVCMTSWVSFIASPMWVLPIGELELLTRAVTSALASMGLCLLLLRTMVHREQSVLLPPSVDDEAQKK